ncbi:MAG: Coq4 family protein [Hyphomonas sp.]
MQKLLADKEDTEQVFHIIEALNGRSLLNNLEAFAATGAGRAQLARKAYLPPLLDDHSWIRDLPEGTVGRAYVDFMEREGLTAQGLVDESEKFRSAAKDYDDDLLWFGNRLRDTHDLYHVLSGYGRDALGEACLLAFSYSQNPGRGVIFIAFMAARQISKSLPKEARVMDCLWEGRRNGRAASQIIQEDILQLLREPLEDARRRLGIRTPEGYLRALRISADAGIAARDISPSAPEQAAA